MELNQEQKTLFDVLEKSRQPLFITGRAGTGKSVLLQYFREHSRKSTAVVAPTGIAALNVRGQTIHSFFRLPIGLIGKDSLPSNDKFNTLCRSIDTIVLDEVSMVRADLMDGIDQRLRQACRNQKPFGGKQIVLFGDLFQLPPVLSGEGLQEYFDQVYGGGYFFNAHVWRNVGLTMCELTEIFRQKDETFKSLLNSLREGMLTEEQLAILNQRCGSLPLRESITLAPTNSLVSQINESRLNGLKGKLFTYRALISGVIKKSSFPTEETLQLKVGAQVILLRNDKDSRWVNGTLATVASLSATEIKVKIGESIYPLRQETWEEIRYTFEGGKLQEEVISSFTQFPLRLAWALTIHKSQGQTYDGVIIDLTHDTFAHGQLYVALSRCTTLQGVCLTKPIERKHVTVDPSVMAFMQQRKGFSGPSSIV